MDEKMILKQQKECANTRKVENEKLSDKLSQQEREINTLKGHIDVSNQITKSMNEKINNIDDKVGKLDGKFDLFIDKIEKGFATKQEFLINDSRIKKLENGVWWVITIVAGILITTIIYSILK